MSVTNEVVKFVAEIELDAQDKAAFTKALKESNEECAAFRKEIAKTEQDMAKLASAGKKDSDEFKKLGEHLNSTKEKLKSSSKEANKYASMLGLNSMTYNQLKAHASKLRKELNSLHKDSDPEVWEKYNKELTETEKRMKEVQGGIKQEKTAIESLSAIGKKLGPTITIASSLFGLLKSGFQQMTEQTQTWGDRWQMTVTKVKAGWNQFVANLFQGKGVIKASINEAIQAAANAQVLLDELFERENSLKIQSVKTQTEINKFMATVKDASKSDAERMAAIEEILKLENKLAEVKRDIAQQELDAYQDLLMKRTQLDKNELKTAIDNYNANRDKFKAAEDYIALLEEEKQLKKDIQFYNSSFGPSSKANAVLQSHIDAAHTRLSEVTDAIKVSGTEEVLYYKRLLEQYNLGNDGLVENYVNAVVKVEQAKADLANQEAQLAARRGRLMNEMRAEDEKEREKAYSKAKDDAESNYRSELNSLKKQLLDRTISQEEYNTQSAELERKRLEKLKEINLKYGKDITVIDGQILDERLKNQNSEAPKRPTTDLSVSGSLTSKLPTKVSSESDPGLATNFETEMTALNVLHEAKLISEEEFLKRRNELCKKYGVEQQEAEQTLWDQGTEGKVQATMTMLDAMGQAVSSAKDAEMATIDAQMQAELAAAGDNAEERERIEAEYEAKRLDVQKKYADVELGISIAQAIAQGALAVIQSWAQLGPVAGSIFAAVVAATTAAQIAVMVQQRNAIKNSSAGGSSGSGGSGSGAIRGYSEGGYTGNGGRLEVAGVVHRGEYVVPQPELRDPTVAAMVASIETRRRRRTSANALPGFAEGGYTGLSGSSRQTEDLLDRIYKAIEAGNNNPIPAYVVLSEINAKQDVIDRFRKQTTLHKKK